MADRRRQLPFRILIFVFAAFISHAYADSAIGAWSSKFKSAPGFNGPVYAVAPMGSDIYVGGEFTEVAGLRAHGLARFDGTNWFEVGGGVSKADFSEVRALAVIGTNLFVGGQFDFAGNVPATNIAKWWGGRWEPLGSGIGLSTNYDTPEISVLTLYVNGTDLYVGGMFSRAGEVDALNIAIWNGSNWQAIDQGVAFRDDTYPEFAWGRVYGIAKVGNDLFVGGAFDQAGGIRATNVAKWNGKTWQDLGGSLNGEELWTVDGGPFSGVIHALCAFQGSVYVGGDFKLIGGLAITNFARWNGGGWENVGATGNSVAAGRITSLWSSDEELIAAGTFTRVADCISTNAAVLRNGSWSPLNIALGTFDHINSLSRIGETIYAGGDFQWLDGASAGYFALRSDDRWAATTPGVGNSPNPAPASLATDGTNVFAVGISSVGTNVASWAKWDGANWTALATPLGAAGPIYSGAYGGGKWMLKGDFIMPNLGRTNLLYYDGSNWRAIELPVPVSDFVFSTDLIGSTDLFLMSCFVRDRQNNWLPSTFAFDGVGWHDLHQIDLQKPGVFGSRIVYFQGTGLGIQYEEWHGLETIPEPVGDPLPITNAYLVALNEIEIWVLGHSITGKAIFHWDGSRWEDLKIEPDSEISALATCRGKLYAAGAFKQIGGVAADGIAEFSDGRWKSMDGGIQLQGKYSWITSLLAVGKKVVATGRITSAGKNESGNFAIWNQASEVRLDSLPNTSSQFSVSGGEGDAVVIERSTDLEDWLEVKKLILPNAPLVIDGGGAQAKQFYRARITEP